jgi:serine/threonine protein kinase
MTTKKLPIFHTTFSIYQATDIIGEGGAGRVYKTTDENGDLFAIKLLNPSLARGEKLRRFKNELFFCLKNKHANILTVLDHGIYRDRDKSSPFYVMPVYDSSLRSLLNSGISQGDAIYYFSQLLDGVEAAHLQGIVHRDLKPENVLFNSNMKRLVVADFGIARFQEEQLVTAVETKPHERLANFLYAAPEQRTRGMVVNQQADIFALGLILNELFTGHVPHGTGYALISSIAPSVAYLDDLVTQMLRQAEKDRPATIEFVKQQLISRKVEFVSRQRASELRQTVVPTSELDDPLIDDPIRLVGADYQHGKLTLFLSQKTNPMWGWAFQNMGSHTAVLGKGPEAFRFAGDKAIIGADESDVQRIIDHFKEWLPRAKRVYESKLKSIKKEEEEELRKKLMAEVEENERRARILKNIRI